MPKFNITSLNPAEIQLENIYMALERFNFSKDTAAWIVGGPKKLEAYIQSGKIRAQKGTNAQCSKWKCNAADVVRHCRNVRKLKN